MEWETTQMLYMIFRFLARQEDKRFRIEWQQAFSEFNLFLASPVCDIVDQVIFLSEYDCSQRGRPYDNRGPLGYNWGNAGYDDRARQVYVYNRNRGRGYEDRNRGYQPGYSRSRGGFGGVDDNDPLGVKGYYGSSDKDDNIGEGTVGFYGRSRRP
jgi:hypothetical protein